LNRKGENRFRPIETKLEIFQDFEYKTTEGKFIATTLTNKGLLRFYENGKYEIDSSARYRDTVQMMFSSLSDKNVIITSGKRELKSIDTEGNLQFDFASPWANNSGNISLFELNGRSYIGIDSKEEGQLILLDQDGHLIEDFPMKGRPPYTITEINNSGEAVILASDENGLFAYRLRL
jgi:hypothetical protein